MHAYYASIPVRAEGCAQCAPLEDLAVFTASGADALSFLHGQLTQDVTGLPQDAARLAGYCTAKGRLLATMVMWRGAGDTDDAPQFYGLVRQDLSQALIKRLSRSGVGMCLMICLRMSFLWVSLLSLGPGKATWGPDLFS